LPTWLAPRRARDKMAILLRQRRANATISRCSTQAGGGTSLAHAPRMGPMMMRSLVNRWASRASLSAACVLAASVLGLALGSLGCGDAGEQEGGLPLVTIAECEEMGGAPLFDPEDERPLELSCPDGLDAIAEFEEDFYGSQGGVCCTGASADGPASSGDVTLAP
jgi:hypothetical protein